MRLGLANAQPRAMAGALFAQVIAAPRATGPASFAQATEGQQVCELEVAPRVIAGFLQGLQDEGGTETMATPREETPKQRLRRERVQWL